MAITSQAVFMAVADFNALTTGATKSALALKELDAQQAKVNVSGNAMMAKINQSAQLLSTGLNAGTRAAADIGTELNKIGPESSSLSKLNQAAQVLGAGMSEGKIAVSDTAKVIGNDLVVAEDKAVKEGDSLAKKGEELWRNMAVGRIAVGSLAVAILTIGAAAVGMGIHFDSAKQQSVIAFTAILKSASLANDTINRIEDTSRFMPFRAQQIIDSTQKLLAFGLPLNQILEGTGVNAKGLIVDIGNAAAAQGPRAAEAFSQITDVFGKISASGKLTERELRQLTDAGIPAFKILEDQLHLTADQVAAVGKTGVQGSVAIQALSKGIQAFYGGTMVAESKSLRGEITTLRDDVEIGLGGAFKGLFTAAASDIDVFTKKLTALDEDAKREGFFKAFGKDVPILGPVIAAVAGAVSALINMLKAGEPVIKAFVGAFAIAWATLMVLQLRLITTILKDLTALLKLIPAPLLQTLGVVAALVVAFRVLKSLDVWKTLLQDAQAVLKYFGLLGEAARVQAAQEAALREVTMTRVEAESALAAATADRLAAEAALRDFENGVGANTDAEIMTALTGEQVETDTLVASDEALLQAKLAVTAAREAEIEAAAQVTVAEVAEAAATESAAGATTGLDYAIGAINPAMVALAVAAAAVVFALRQMDGSIKAQQASTQTATDTAKTLATSLGQTYNALVSQSDATNKAAVTIDDFTAKNQNAIKTLHQLKDATQQAYLIETGVSLIQHGVTPADALKDIQKLADASGVKIKFTIDPASLTNANIQIQAFDASATATAQRLQHDLSSWKLKFISDNITGGTLTKAAQDIKNLGTTLGDTFKSGNYGVAFQEIATASDALKAKNVPKYMKDILDAMTSDMDISVKLTGSINKQNTAWDNTKRVLESIAAPTSTASQQLKDYANWVLDATNKGEPFAAAIDAANKKLAAQQAAANQAVSGIQAIDQAYTAATEDATAFTQLISDTSKTIGDFVDSTKVFTDATAAVKQDAQTNYTDATQAATDSYNAQKQALDDWVAAQQNALDSEKQNLQARQAQQTQDLALVGGGTAAGKKQLRDEQINELKALDDKLANFNKEKAARAKALTDQKAADDAAAKSSKTAADSQVLSLQQYEDALQKQIGIEENWAKNVATIYSRFGKAAGDAIVQLGPAGAALAGQFATATDAQGQKLATLLQTQQDLIDSSNKKNLQSTVTNWQVLGEAADQGSKFMASAIALNLGISRQQVYDIVKQYGTTGEKAAAAFAEALDQANLLVLSDAQKAKLQAEWNWIAGAGGNPAISTGPGGPSVISTGGTRLSPVPYGSPKAPVGNLNIPTGKKADPLFVSLVDPTGRPVDASGKPINAAGGTGTKPYGPAVPPQVAPGAAGRIDSTGNYIPPPIQLPPPPPGVLAAQQTKVSRLTQVAGGIAAAAGLITPNLPSAAVIAPEGTQITWAEPGTGGEAFIPLSPTKRSTSLPIWWQVGKNLGVVPVNFEFGGTLVDNKRVSFDMGGTLAPTRSLRFAEGGYSPPTRATASSGLTSTTNVKHFDMRDVIVMANDPSDFAKELDKKARSQALAGVQ